MHTVTVLALNGVLAFDLSTPVEVFGRVRLPDGRAAYEVRVCAPADEVDAGVFTIRAPWALDTLEVADTVVVPGLADPAEPVAEEVLGALWRAAEGGARIASICVGAFTLAAAGLLNGLRATTHWAAAEKLARLYPDVEVDADVLFIDNGQVLTSAGAAAGLDLCLYMIRQYHGSTVAADAARVAVMPLERDGGQAQFIVHEPPGADGASLEPLLRCGAGRPVAARWTHGGIRAPAFRTASRSLHHAAGARGRRGRAPRSDRREVSGRPGAVLESLRRKRRRSAGRTRGGWPEVAHHAA